MATTKGETKIKNETCREPKLLVQPDSKEGECIRQPSEVELLAFLMAVGAKNEYDPTWQLHFVHGDKQGSITEVTSGSWKWIPNRPWGDYCSSSVPTPDPHIVTAATAINLYEQKVMLLVHTTVGPNLPTTLINTVADYYQQLFLKPSMVETVDFWDRVIK